MGFATTKTSTFSLTNARYLASKVAVDMQACHARYGQPTVDQIRNYEEELAAYLSAGFLQEYEFGFKQNERRILTWKYVVDATGRLCTDDSPGGLAPIVDVSHAVHFNYLTQNSAFFRLGPDAQNAFRASVPVYRTFADPPGDGSGFWSSDRNYYSGGRALTRQTFQPKP